MTMQLVFTKGSGKYDRMDVVRDGVVAGTIQCPKQGIIPHDMVHYAVESTLHKRGFISRIADGEAASFQMQAEAESDSVERLVEVFQGDGWSGYRSAPAEMLDLYAVTCKSRQCEPLHVSTDDIEAVRQRILELTAQWEAVPVGKALTLDVEPGTHAP
jgi:hypothetical protein